VGNLTKVQNAYVCRISSLRDKNPKKVVQDTHGGGKPCLSWRVGQERRMEGVTKPSLTPTLKAIAQRENDEKKDGDEEKEKTIRKDRENT